MSSVRSRCLKKNNHNDYRSFFSFPPFHFSPHTQCKSCCNVQSHWSLWNSNNEQKKERERETAAILYIHEFSPSSQVLFFRCFTWMFSSLLLSSRFVNTPFSPFYFGLFFCVVPALASLFVVYFPNHSRRFSPYSSSRSCLKNTTFIRGLYRGWGVGVFVFPCGVLPCGSPRDVVILIVEERRGCTWKLGEFIADGLRETLGGGWEGDGAGWVKWAWKKLWRANIGKPNKNRKIIKVFINTFLVSFCQ